MSLKHRSPVRVAILIQPTVSGGPAITVAR
jgi:hypothetical protein